MVHEFNPFTGRLKQSTQSQPLYPLSPRPLQSADPPVMIFDTIKTKVVSTKAPAQGNYSTLSPKLATIYKKYQADLSKPSYMLAGKRDKVLLGVTAVWTAVNSVMCLYELISTSK